MILEVDQISKTYSKSRKRKAFTLNIGEFSIEEGSFAAILGPNGSGKSTFIKIMLDLVFADQGSLTLMGADHKQKEARTKIGYLPENFSFPKYFTVHQIMKIFGAIGNTNSQDLDTRISELSEALDVDFLDERFKDLSKGMRQTTAIMHTLLGGRSFYILDEPLNGLDAVQKERIIEYLLHLKKQQNISLLITTHILPDIDKLCDTIHLIKEGQIIHSSTKKGIKEQYSSVESYYLNYFKPQPNSSS